MAGVVGPNGCGKSNVIDAVRWVMGESSAKQLRGDSMTDVIFNGSGGRKPVNQASIELVFDNSDGRIVGEYASYNEISVRRRVTRDGQSDYYLNNSKCRRRDIMDIFLGTGLGPRSYAIIEQGMISNLITAKPEELRVFLEEAAGISKYKERRRETENRMRRTQENLERLTDLREELERQLQRLQRQSQAAEKYREYKIEERELKTQLLALRWRSLDQEVTGRQEQIAEVELAVEKGVLGDLECNTEIESLREGHVESTDTFNKIQATFYESGAHIARIEQDIHHREERQRQLAEDIRQTAQSYEEVQHHLKEDSSRAEAWKAEVEELTRQQLESHTEASDAEKALRVADEAMSAWQQEWDIFQKSSSASKREADVQQSSIQHIERSLKNHVERRDRLSSQGSSEADLVAMAAQITQVESQQLAMTEQLTRFAATESDDAQAVAAARAQLSSLGSDLDATRNQLQSARGRMSSLEALQEAALEDTDAGTEAWLSEQGIGESQRIAETMTVQPGWETAVETVLGGSLRAVCVDDIDAYATHFDRLSEGHVELVETKAVDANGDYLASKVNGDVAPSLLSLVQIATDLGDALKKRRTLTSGQSVVTPDGIWFGANWCRLNRGNLTTSGVLGRKADIESLEQDIQRLEEAEQQARENIEQAQAGLLAQEERQRSVRRDKEKLASELSDVKSQFSAISAKREQLVSQRDHNQRDLNTTLEHIDAQEKQLAEARRLLATALDEMEGFAIQQSTLQDARDTKKLAQSSARTQHQQLSQRDQQLGFRIQTVNTQLQSVQESIERASSQLSKLDERKANLQQTPDQSEDDPLIGMRDELEERLQARLEVEGEMTEARKGVQDIEHKLQAFERKRQEIQQSLSELRETLSARRLTAQDLITRRQTLVEQLGDDEVDTVLESLPDDASEQDWQQQLEKMATRIQRLGPINLAAIDEYKTESERKEYLDAQDEELQSALETLRDAISKIDRETRTRFKETFDKVNAGVKELFPKLFGGGHAYLELTSDDYLETGVSIMARPPGKRNSTIQLLSGGEKALTAISLVFAIFQLNPAPFCMLDEVDAPLDDANCGRFARMVKEMSEKVQFIFITHNKITMEQANQLMGVTMHEPGVSRLVSVDVEEAIELAAV